MAQVDRFVGQFRDAHSSPTLALARAVYVHIPFCATNAVTATSPRSPGSTIWPIDIWRRSSARSRPSSPGHRRSTRSSWAAARPRGLSAASWIRCAASSRSGSLSPPTANGRSRRTPARSTQRRPTCWTKRASTASAWARSHFSRGSSLCSSVSTAVPRSKRRSRSSARDFRAGRST